MPTRRYRPRRRHSVPLEEQEEMVALYCSGGITQREITRRHRVKPRLVFDLVRESRLVPEKKREEKQKRKSNEERREAVKATASAILSRGRPIVNSSQIRQEVRASLHQVVTNHVVRRVLREDLKLSYIQTKKMSPQSNSVRCLLQRQEFARTLIRLLEDGKRVINIDETWLNETSYLRRSWAPRDGRGNTISRAVSPRLSMIAALDTEGQAWFSLSHANTDSNLTALFLHHLAAELD